MWLYCFLFIGLLEDFLKAPLFSNSPYLFCACCLFYLNLILLAVFLPFPAVLFVGKVQVTIRSFNIDGRKISLLYFHWWHQSWFVILVDVFVLLNVVFICWCMFSANARFIFKIAQISFKIENNKIFIFKMRKFFWIV